MQAGQNPLQIAVREGRCDIVEVLLMARANIEVADEVCVRSGVICWIGFEVLGQITHTYPHTPHIYTYF